ncbi:Flavin containing amine oxidoreductase [Ceratobasidium sp. AG-Ba]|nr:Flavin containing amine oxidoreductase [Ceratobasidium sp. AG-Ba]
MGLYDVGHDDTASVFWMNAARIIDEYHARLVKGGLPPTEQTKAIDNLPEVKRIAIIGGGVSGLHAAMKLGTKYKVDVYEAADRVGGRLFTYDFKNGNEWDYFDVGAMRFPDTTVMKTTYDLFDELGLPLLDYHMSTKESFLYYNGIRIKRKDFQNQDFGARVSQGGNVPDEWAKIGYNKLMDNVCARWVHALRTDHKKYFPKLLEYDEHSTRSLMAFVTFPEVKDPITGEVLFEAKPKYPTEVINWLETMTFSAGWFDRAFVETILELYAFADGLPDTKWRCVRHGSQRITDAMKLKLETDETYKENVTIHLSHQVTSVVYNRDLGELTISGKRRPTPESPDPTPFEVEEKYSQVILAVSPQVMRYMDLKTCRLDYTQRSALLMLSPGPSTKVGIKFTKNWWKELGIVGGQSQTDLPVRTVVYPSYGDGESTVLIASYCWTQDAASMGALMQGEKTFDEERLKVAMLRDLTEVHGLEPGYLDSLYDGMFPFDWAHNPTTMGAYAFFGPGQFKSLFASMTRPAADLRLHFAGEAISTCHAWVAGALESANRVAGQIDPSEYLAEQPGSMHEIPHGKSEKDYPVLLGRNLLLKQMSISNYLQEREFATA